MNGPTQYLSLARAMAAGGACAILLGAAAALPPPPPPVGGPDIARFTISPAAGGYAHTRDEISLDTARRITDVCLQFAAAHNQRVSVFVLSPAGNIVYAARMDGQGPVNIDTGLMKAKSALYMRDSTRFWSNFLYDNVQTEVRFLPIGQFWVPGGLPIIVDGVLIGAIGVGGGNVDEECAYAGLTQVIGPQPPLQPVIPPRPLPARPDAVPHPQ